MLLSPSQHRLRRRRRAPLILGLKAWERLTRPLTGLVSRKTDATEFPLSDLKPRRPFAPRNPA
jgi:hypothetical protein